MATVLQAYKAGQEIFNHAWQGIPVGGDVQAKFMKRNARLLRTALYQTMNTYAPQGQELNTSARVVHPRATVPVPNRYQLSQGSYNVECFEEVGSAGEWRLKTPTGADAPTSWEDFYKKIGLVEGDIYTFCWFQQTDSLAYRTETETGSIDPRRSVWNCNFVYARFRVLPPPTDAFDYSQPLTKVMEYTGGTASIGSYENYLNLRSALVIGNVVGKYSWGLIRSREDSPLRSTSFMGSPRIATAYGIAPTVINEVWTRNGQPLGNSDLILEGGGDDVAPEPVPPPVPYTHRLMLRDGTITQNLPQNLNDIMGVEYDTGKFALGGSFNGRKPASGRLANNGDIDATIRSTLRPQDSNFPAGAYAVNRYYMESVIRVVKQLCEDLGLSYDNWFSHETGSDIALSCQSYSNFILGYKISTESWSLSESANNYNNYGYVWLVEI